MLEYQKLLDVVERELESDSSITLKIPQGLLTMLRFIEEKEALEAGRDPEPVEEVLLQRVENDLQDVLHWLSVEPSRLPYFRNLWNRLCAAEGQPDLSIPEPDGP